ncbi:hypothetical protein MKK88_15745, partial [Methylobacterium sp. E-005]|nr:hypothetical protein [Methylobacterium sp. E-005]
YVRVPMADVAPMLAPEGVDDESLLFLTDILPTGWQGAEHCEIKGGEARDWRRSSCQGWRIGVFQRQR